MRNLFFGGLLSFLIFCILICAFPIEVLISCFKHLFGIKVDIKKYLIVDLVNDVFIKE